MSIKKFYLSFIPRAGQHNGSWFFFTLTLLIIFSCSTVSPLSSEQEHQFSFAEIENTAQLPAPQWQQFASGIDYLHGRFESPRLEFWALRIDLFSSDIGIVVNAGGSSTSRSSTSGLSASGLSTAGNAASPAAGNFFSTRVSSFVRDNNLIAGINAAPFNISTFTEGLPIQNIGIIISDGVLLSPASRYYDALVFYKTDQSSGETNGGMEPENLANPARAAIVRQSSIQGAENIENAIGGFHQILTSGEPAQRTLYNEARHPRSAAGVSADGRYLFLLVIDGRRAASVGGTERETALLLKALGSYDGLNLDGGGSSALAMRFPDGNVRTVNRPVHGGIPGRERAVAGCIGIKINQ